MNPNSQPKDYYYEETQGSETTYYQEGNNKPQFQEYKYNQVNEKEGDKPMKSNKHVYYNDSFTKNPLEYSISNKVFQNKEIGDKENSYSINPDKVNSGSSKK